ncbi:conserved hypothetical protein [Theileria equi strain WA]|uniref:THUMP domain-containing protein n=1 Tax=Theileria equi strain WA TaxID=1537102 RepID=L1LE87_THEEQ|nr:conserved hypothetical protein [Theileria equi strain WA]EKX73478.1 conserved hypothetical protein [Theileria equi strain WA]|eukprot:XP_004832930.1 conserved hypothetical protein [Theileria equi strain WA]
MGEKRRSDAKGPKWKKLKQESGKLVLGSKGILITNSFSGKYKEAMQEALSILRQHCEDFYPLDNQPVEAPATGETSVPETDLRGGAKQESKTSDHRETLESHHLEKDGLRGPDYDLDREKEEINKYFNRFTPGPCISKGLNFVYFNNESDVPSKYIQEIFSEIKRHKSYSARYLSRLVPVDYVCNATFSTVQETLRRLISKEFPESTCSIESRTTQESEDVSSTKKSSDETKDVITWALEYKSTNSNALKRQEILDLVVAMIGKNYKVELKKPDKLVVIQVVKGLCGISVITNYSEIAHFKLNISIPRD